jgi:hypothetical protein
LTANPTLHILEKGIRFEANDEAGLETNWMGWIFTEVVLLNLAVWISRGISKEY